MTILNFNLNEHIMQVFKNNCLPNGNQNYSVFIHYEEGTEDDDNDEVDELEEVEAEFDNDCSC